MTGPFIISDILPIGNFLSIEPPRLPGPWYSWAMNLRRFQSRVLEKSIPFTPMTVISTALKTDEWRLSSPCRLPKRNDSACLQNCNRRNGKTYAPCADHDLSVAAWIPYANRPLSVRPERFLKRSLPDVSRRDTRFCILHPFTAIHVALPHP